MPGRSQATLVPPSTRMAPDLALAATGAASLPRRGDAGLRPGPNRIGRILLNKYRIEALIGEGGCGRVYRARHLVLGNPVAVKFMLPDLSASKVQRARFAREAQLLARLRHPGVVGIHDYGEDAGELYMVLEYVAGRPLSLLLLEQPGTLPIPRVVALFDQLLDVLVAAHACGITHRDLKPSNIMLYQDDGSTERIKLIDFGMAFMDDKKLRPRLTQEGQTIGTVLFMAPEQCTGQHIGPPADIYAAGLILYQMLSGRLPFSAHTTKEAMAHHLHDDPLPIGQLGPAREVPPQLEALARWALQKSPEARPTALELRQALHQAMEVSGRLLRPVVPLIPMSISKSLAEAGPGPKSASAPNAQEREPKTVEAVVLAAQDMVIYPLVALWGFPYSLSEKLLAALAPHHVRAFHWAEENPPPQQLANQAISAVVIPCDEQAQRRLRELRADSQGCRLPALVTGVAAAESVLPLIRAGASDMVLAQTSQEQLCSQVVRLIRRGR